jgi:hypothetical protein
MSQSYSGPVYATNAQNVFGSIVNGTGAGTLGSDTNGISIYTAGANGSRVFSLILSTTDTAANNVLLYIKNGAGSVCPVALIVVPAYSGILNGTSVAIPCVDGLASANAPGLSFDGTGKPYIELAPSAILKFAVIAAVTATKTLYATAIGADY